MGYNDSATNVTYTGVIYNHFMGIISRAYLREDANVMLDTLWGMLDPWIDDDLRKLWRIKTMKGGYSAMMWKMRCCMLVLYNLQALPSTQAPNPEKTLVYHEYSGYGSSYENEVGVKISESIMFKTVMMRYLYLFTELIQEGADIETLTYMIDLGYCFCTPYLSYEEYEEWQEVQSTSLSPWRGFIDKFRIVMGILDRESLLFARRVVDTTTLWEEQQMGDYSDNPEFNRKILGD